MTLNGFSCSKGTYAAKGKAIVFPKVVRPQKSGQQYVINALQVSVKELAKSMM